MSTFAEQRVQAPIIHYPDLIRDKDENISYRRREKSCEFH